jgi:hypothetical protein
MCSIARAPIECAATKKKAKRFALGFCILSLFFLSLFFLPGLMSLAFLNPFGGRRGFRTPDPRSVNAMLYP